MAKQELFQVETNILPKPKLILVFSGLAFSLLICFIDQNGISIALPTIGADLNASSTIAWAGTASLISNTIFQVLWGRLSDIFGRKGVYLTAVGMLALGDLLCGFAKTGPQLYFFRAISGAATGGIIAMTMVIVSDVVTLEERGKYQGILGSMIGLGNSMGPFIAAAFAEKGIWRGLFWTICPVAALAGLVVSFILPKSIVTGDPRKKAKAIDYYGFLTSTIAILLLLIPISGGGTYFSWSSPMVISMLILGSICVVVFLVIELKIALMPMVQMRLFRIPAVSAIIAQNFLYGIVYYSHLYYLPIYYQDARQYSPLTAATLTLPFVAGQAFFSILSGQYVSRTKRYGEVIWVGYTLWLLGTGLVLLFDRTTPKWKIILILITEGAGVGNVFQPTLIAAQAHSRKHDRAIVISMRNFLRCLGGAIGLALSSAIFSNVLKSRVNALQDVLSEEVRSSILASVVKVPDLTALAESQREDILDAYMAASRAVFVMWVPLMGACLLLCALIKDRGLVRPDEKNETVTPVLEEGDLEHGLQTGRREDEGILEHGVELRSREGEVDLETRSTETGRDDNLGHVEGMVGKNVL